MATKFKTWGDYFIPGTEVLRNKLGIDNEGDLRDAEEQLSWARIVDLDAHPIAGSFDYEHMKAIHRHIFQDVYEWAGEQRVGPQEPQVMIKGGPNPADPDGPTIGYGYSTLSYIAPHLDQQYRRIARQDYFRGLEKADFVDNLADVWGEINFAHAFREGNTRTQILFFDQLCEQAGYELDREAFLPGTPSRDEFVAARFRVMRTGKHDAMAQFLEQVVDPAPAASEPSATMSLNDRKRKFPELYRSDEADDQQRSLEM